MNTEIRVAAAAEQGPSEAHTLALALSGFSFMFAVASKLNCHSNVLDSGVLCAAVQRSLQTKENGRTGLYSNSSSKSTPTATMAIYYFTVIRTD